MEALSVGRAEIDRPGVRRLRVHDPSSPSPGTLGPSPLVAHSVFCVGAGRHDLDVRTITKGAPSSSHGSRWRPEPSRTRTRPRETSDIAAVVGLLLEAGAILGYWSRRAASA